MPPLLAAYGVGKRFGSLSALADVDLALRAGEIHCLLGENGAGKSTLCNLLFGPTGSIGRAGRPMPWRRASPWCISISASSPS